MELSGITDAEYELVREHVADVAHKLRLHENKNLTRVGFPIQSYSRYSLVNL